MASPAIACVGIIGRHNNPLHVSLFPPHTGTEIEFSLLLSSTLDIFESRLPQKTADQDLGLLQALDERLACYGWATNTGVKFVIVVDMAGRPDSGNLAGRNSASGLIGLRDADLKPAFKALQTAYIRLLQNPFYNPDEHSPLAQMHGGRTGNMQITSKRFINEVDRVGKAWAPGVTNL
ncbi:MAG: hypothetical protein M4579_006940 [Chaenotheca gracillima]|nr:MAG: hypothetical protein M4579_006940 [Chaenotheca gracillima]